MDSPPLGWPAQPRAGLGPAVLGLACLYAAAALAEPAPVTGDEAPPKPPCIEVRTEAPFIQAYNHIVVLHSRCEHTMRCTVYTDVNPKPQTVDVPPGEVVRVLTFRGSPSSRFTPTVDCAEKH